MRYTYIIIIVLLTFISIVVNSCCTEKHCVGADDLENVFLLNFSESEVDSVFVVSYRKGSDFKTVADSFIVPKVILPNNDSLVNVRYDMFLWGKRINTDYDYRIIFSKINRAYRISGFKTSKDECNGCYPGFVKDYFKRLDGYEINGVFKNLGFIQIDKNID
jgi:hypothetical protein